MSQSAENTLFFVKTNKIRHLQKNACDGSDSRQQLTKTPENSGVFHFRVAFRVAFSNYLLLMSIIP